MTSSSRTVPVTGTTRAAVALPRLPIERYRGIAAVMLALMLAITALAPLGTTAPASSRILPTAFNARAGEDLYATLFDYVAESQRQPPMPPARHTILREASLTAYARTAIAAELLIESGGADPETGRPETPHPVRDAALAGGPERWENMETFYGMVRDAWAVNGLGAVMVLKSISATGEERLRLEQEAVEAFVAATTASPGRWQYPYNWGLAEILRGNYQQAAVLLDRARQAEPGNVAIGFHLGLALLRLGEPERAIGVWARLTENPDRDWGRAVSEALGDALVARGDGGAAAEGYMSIQNNIDAVDWGIYEKLLRLQMLRGPESLLDTITALANRFPDEPRLHYDRGRVLMMLGRNGTAGAELRRAAELRPDEPAFHLGLAQLSLATGRPADAAAQAETALQKAGLDPNAAQLELVYSRIQHSDRYQQSFAQQILEAHLVRAAAWRELNLAERAQALAEAVLAQGGDDPARASWFRYYAGLIYSAGGLSTFAQQIFRDGLEASAGAGPEQGAWALAWARSLGDDELAAQYPEALRALGGEGGQPAAARDASTAYAYHEFAARLEEAGRQRDAAPLYRAAAAWEAGRRSVLNQPPLSANGLFTPVELQAAEADFLLRDEQYQLAAARYQRLLSVEPSAAGAHTNRGIAFEGMGDQTLARREFELAARLDSGNTLAQHNLAMLALRDGLTGIPTALDALGAARVSGGAGALWLGGDILAAPQSVGLPAPVARPGFMARVPALLALLLLLLHTLIFSRRREAEETGARDSGAGVLGALGETLASRLPALALWPTLAIAVVLSGLAWGVATAGSLGTAGAWLTFILLGLLAAAVAIGAQEAAQFFFARRERQPGRVGQRLWPLGLAITLVGAPFGLVYGWTVATRASAGAQHEAEDAPQTPAPAAAQKTRGSRRVSQPVAPAAAPATDRLPWRGWAALGPPARVAAAGLLANLALALLFGVLYGWLGNPLWRVLTIANVAVLAFTAVSEPQAEGWHLWRRSPLLWLFLFLAAAAALTALLLGVV